MSREIWRVRWRIRPSGRGPAREKAGTTHSLFAAASPRERRRETAKRGKGTMCVLHARLTAKNETTGSTSTAKGHTLIKVREDGAITFKTQINNPNHETFIAGHIHKAPVGVP